MFVVPSWSMQVDLAEVALLTSQERCALLGLALGHSPDRIGHDIAMSPHSVRHTLTAAKEKLGARTLTEAAAAVLLVEIGCSPK